VNQVDPSLSGIRYEIAELVADGLIEPTGEFRPRRDGTLAPVYRVTELGRQDAKAKRRRLKGE
jgi:DNA-binding PadR family transcriptional regulator